MRGAEPTRRTTPSQPHSRHHRRCSAGSTPVEEPVRIAVISPAQCGAEPALRQQQVRHHRDDRDPHHHGGEQDDDDQQCSILVRAPAGSYTSVTLPRLPRPPPPRMNSRIRRSSSAKSTGFTSTRSRGTGVLPGSASCEMSPTGTTPGKRAPVGCLPAWRTARPAPSAHPEVGDDHFGLPPGARQPRQRLGPVLRLGHRRPRRLKNLAIGGARLLRRPR